MTSRTTNQATAFSAELAGSLVSFTPTKYITEPLKFAVMIAKYQESFLLVYNRFRVCWELPGGLIDEGESAQEAAVRELFEETGQKALNERLLGRLEVSGKSTTVGTLYGCKVTELRPFTPNDEVAELFLWHGQEMVGVQFPGQLNELDQRLIALYDVCKKPK